MARTKITSNVLALSAAQTNINNDGSFTLSVPTQINNTVSVSGNLTVDTNTLFVDSTNNRVGIGTNNPQQAIDFRPVTFDANQSGGIRFDNTAGQWPCGIYIRSDGVGGPRLSLDAPFQTNTLNLYSNNVGIGTTTPNEKLTVVGNISTTGNLTVDTNTLFVDSVNNRVGIGVSPLSSIVGKLDVTGSPTTTTPSDVLVLSRPFNAGIGFPSIVSFKLANPNSSINNTRLDIALMQGNSSTPRSPDTTVMTLMGNGNVGIGTTTPNEKLTVVGNISATGALSAVGQLVVDAPVGVNHSTKIIARNTNSLAGNDSSEVEVWGQNSAKFIGRDGAGNQLFNMGYDSNAGGVATIGYGAGISIRMNAGQQISMGGLTNDFGSNSRVTIAGRSDTLTHHNLVLQPATSQTGNILRWNNPDTTAAGVIAPNGNLGIGTETPNEKLTVVGSISATGNLTVDTNTLFVDSVNNRVGIGTATPGGAKLVIKNDNDSSTWLLQTQNDNGNTNSLFTQNAAGDFVWNGYRNGTSLGSPELALHTNGNSFFNGGNVGIGTATPSTPLHTYTAGNNSLTIEAGTGDSQVMLRSGGSQRFLFGYEDADDGFRIYNNTTASTALFVKSTTGNIGIGTTTPNEKLTVVGNISAIGNVAVTGHFSAATKSFKIPHQSKGGHLQYGVVESDCHSVLVRGKISSDTITLPEHWSWLVDADSVTVQLTPVGCYQQLYIVSSDNQTVKVGGVTGEYCYVVYGTRKDVAPLEVEIE